jgi:hypothetical protein
LAKNDSLPPKNSIDKAKGIARYLLVLPSSVHARVKYLVARFEKNSAFGSCLWLQ